MRKWASILAILISLSLSAGGQENKTLDSLKLRLDKEKTDTGKVMLWYRISYELQVSDIGHASEYARKAHDEAVRIKFKKGTGHSLIQLGNIEQIRGNLSLSDNYNLQALEILTRIKDYAGIAVCNNNLGINAHSRNDFFAAMKYYRESLRINRTINRRSGEATSLFCIGTVYENQAMLDSALIYYLKGQEISETIGDNKLNGYAKTSLANIYFRMEDYKKSVDYNLEAAEIFAKTGNNYGLLKTYMSLGQTAQLLDSLEMAIWFYKNALKTAIQLQSPNDIAYAFLSAGQLYEDYGHTDSALINYKRAADIYSYAGSKENTALSYTAQARMQNLKNNHNEAKKILENALEIANEIKSPAALTESYFEMAKTWSYMKDFQKAFYYMTRYTDTRDSLMTEEKQKQILELQTQFETERKEKENIILKKDQQVLQTTRNSLIIGTLLLAALIVVIFRSLSMKKKDNKILRQQKEEIARQKDIVDLQKTAITDSIRYAKRIQSAMLPPGELIENTIPDSFILYLPRDIVSGDFYWMREMEGNRIIVAAADCTGHGVPGAFMSMLGMSLLNDIVNTCHEKIIHDEIHPSDILNNMRERIKDSLRQTGKDGEARDGLDMTLCFIDMNSGKLQFAGANNPVYWVHNQTLTELRGTRNPIGIYLNEMSFANQEAILPEGSVLYMFSDGYSDQIGAGGGKFLSKNFKKMLTEIGYMPVSEIRERLLKTHLEWRKDEEQVDDILVLGIRIGRITKS